MKAARYDQYAGPEVLYEGSAPAPSPQPGEVLVQVHAASVNKIDGIVPAGALRLVTGRRFPLGTGIDFAGLVVGCGEGANPFALGDRVWGCLSRGRSGTAAELVCVGAEQLSLSPQGLDLVEAAALPAVGLTAIIALHDVARLKTGDRLLVRGGSGRVVSVAVQLGRATGAHVPALVRASHRDWVRELVADEALDYATTRPAGLGPFDAILDTVGSETSAYRR